MYMRFSSLGKLAVLALGVGMGLSSHAFADGISATATFTNTPDASLAGVNDYSITLNNTGTTPIGTFWFGWVPGNGFLSATPTDIGTPAGWTEMTTNSGAAIQFVTSTPLAAGGGSSSQPGFHSTGRRHRQTFCPPLRAWSRARAILNRLHSSIRVRRWWV